jgi:hypothetical protein
MPLMATPPASSVVTKVHLGLDLAEQPRWG